MNLFHPCVSAERVFLLYADDDLGVALWRSEDGGKAFPPGQKTTAWGGLGKLQYRINDGLRLDLIAVYRTYQNGWKAGGGEVAARPARP